MTVVNILNIKFSKMGVKRLLCFLILLIILTILLISYNQSFKITTYKVSSEKDINDIRIVFVSDLHLKEYGKGNIKLLNTIKELNPSLIAVGGDSIIYNVKDYDSAIHFLNESAKIAPTYFSLGNHEWSEIYYNDSYELLTALKNSDAYYLENKMIKTKIDNEDIIICGIIDNITALYESTDNVLTELNNEEHDDIFKLVLSHRPMTITVTNITPEADLVLSGHEHGGQVIIPFTNQGLYSRNQGWFPKYTSGSHIIANNLVIISTGLSNSNHLIPRVNNKPELVVIDVN